MKCVYSNNKIDNNISNYINLEILLTLITNNINLNSNFIFFFMLKLNQIKYKYFTNILLHKLYNFIIASIYNICNKYNIHIMFTI